MLNPFYGVAWTVSGATPQVADGAEIEVRYEDTGALVAASSLFDDKDGLSPKSTNPFTADSLGRFHFYAEGREQGYRIKVTKDASSYTLNSQALGTAQEFDATTYAGSLLAAATAAAARSVLGLGALAVLDTVGTSEIDDGAVTEPKYAYPRSYIAGLVIANNGTDADHDIDISVGECRDGAHSANMVLGSALTKQIDAAWAVGTNQGGLDTGTVAADTWYYVWLIKRSDTGVVDALFSTSASAPTMPANYDKKRLIGAVLTDASANIVAFKGYEQSGGGLAVCWDTPTNEHNTTNAITTTASLITLKVPVLPVLAVFGVTMVDAGQGFIRFSDPATSDILPSGDDPATSTYRSNSSAQGLNRHNEVFTSTGQIRARASVTVDTSVISTYRWEWSRR